MNTEFQTAQPHASWRKSSYSTSTGSCVEVASATDGVLVRDSKHPAGGTLAFPRSTWAVFVHGRVG
jgi:hypothetical protein